MDWKNAFALKEEFDNIILSPLNEQIINRALELISLIGEINGDDERAHSMEKDLWEKMLLNSNDPLCQLVLKSRDIKFSRWFA